MVPVRVVLWVIPPVSEFIVSGEGRDKQRENSSPLCLKLESFECMERH